MPNNARFQPEKRMSGCILRVQQTPLARTAKTTDGRSASRSQKAYYRLATTEVVSDLFAVIIL